MTPNYSILIIEDEKNILEFMSKTLKANGYRVTTAATGKAGLAIINSQCPDIILLDLGLPDIDGNTIISSVRKWTSCPIIVISARMGERDKVTALDLGADDYVTKPFGMMELISRIKAVLRRSQKGSNELQDIIKVGDIEIDTKKHEVTAAGEIVNLTLKEYELLKRLMKNSNIVMTRDLLLEEIWGYDFDGETRTVDVHVRTLRQKLGKSGERIETVRGVGYRMRE